MSKWFPSLKTMASRSSADDLDLGRTSILCSWSFTSIATLGMIVCQLHFLGRQGGFRLYDYTLVVSFIVTVVLN